MSIYDKYKYPRLMIKGDMMKYIATKEKAEIFELYSKHISQPKAEYFKQAGIEFVFGTRSGAYINNVDNIDENKTLINCHCNGGVFNLGHRNPEIINSLIDGLEELDIGNHHFVSEQKALLAKKIAELTPGELSHTIFGVSGGEAIDLAIKIARSYTKKSKVISAKGGYHGHTGFALATGDDKYKAPFGPMVPQFVQVPFNDIEALKKEITEDTAAIIFETIPATLGISIPDDDFFQNVRELCDQNNIVFIIDEVQTGLGRTGKLWGIEHYNVVPDIMVIGKGLSGGIYPMSATIFKGKYQSVFMNDPFIHISTFGGADIGCPVAMKVLEISSDKDFLQHIEELAEIFRKGFERLKMKHPEILVGLRQKRLMMGIEMVNEQCGPVLTKTCYENGLLSIFAANDSRISQLLPPLNIEVDLAEEIIERLDISLGQAKAILGLTKSL